jgi:hypothetical protein
MENNFSSLRKDIRFCRYKYLDLFKPSFVLPNHFVHNLYCYHLIQQCQMASHHAPTQVGGNKAAYKGLRSRMCFLTMGTYIDSVSGWILMAFLFYRLKQYNLCTRILRHIELVCSSQSYILYVPESTASQLMYLILVIMEEKKRTASVRATF